MILNNWRKSGINEKLKFAYSLLPLALCLFFLSACGSGTTTSETGTIRSDLEWEPPSQRGIASQANPSIHHAIAAASSDVCVDYGIATVNAKVLNSANAEIASGSWPCSAHSGTITGVPVGSNYTVRLEGTVSDGAVNWRGEKTGITVSAGSTANTGTITMTYIGNDTTPPTVAAHNPSINETSVPVSNFITVLFSERMSSTLIDTTTFTLKKGTTSASGAVAYNPTTRIATFTPSSNLDFSSTYNATITNGVEDLAGIRMVSSYSWSFTTEAPPVAPPSAPTGVTASAGDRQLGISWNSVSGAISYNLYWSTSPGVTRTTGTKIANVPSPYTHVGLTNGTTYYYVVTAINSSGESGASIEVPGTPGTAPSAPTGVTVTPGSSQIEIRWNSVSGATSYNIYWSTTFGVTKTTGTKVANAAMPHVHTGLTAGTTYYYVVTAVNSYGESGESSQAWGAPGGIPPAPAGVTTGGGDMQVAISWNSVNGANFYNIYWSTTSGVTKSTGTKIFNATSPYTHTGLTNGTTYYYVVTAVNSFGESVESSQASGSPGTAPSAPTGVTVTAGDGQAGISWSSVAEATSYNLYWSTSSGVTKTTSTKIANVTSTYLHTGLTNGTTYYYVVTAVNSYGESVESGQVSGTLGTVPRAPTGVAAYAGDRQVGISWNTVTGATSYNIYWSTTSGVSKGSGTKIANVTSTYIHSGLTNGTTYYYVVTAVNSFGESSESNQVWAASGMTPTAPTGVVAAAGNGQLYISWNSVNGAMSYNIYWSTTSGVTVTNGTKISNVTSPYIHAGLTNGSPYYYVVTAVNSIGESAASSQVSGTPLSSAYGWVATGAMSQQRIHVGGILLPNGKVLVAGGSQGGSSTIYYSNTAELYDPELGTFISTGSMNQGRGWHFHNNPLVILNNGNVLIPGGYSWIDASPGTNFLYLNSAELYNPSTGVFSQTGAMPGSEGHHTATLLQNGKVLIAGPLQAIYDPSMGIFSSPGAINTQRSFHAATLLPNGKVLITGGVGTSGPTAPALDTAELFDPISCSFLSAGRMNYARHNHQQTLLPDGRVFITGGFKSFLGGGDPVNFSEIYDPSTGVFSFTGSMNYARGDHTATLLMNGKVLIAGGQVGSTEDSRLSELYDPTTGQFEINGRMTQGSSEHLAIVLPNGNVLVTGGARSEYAELYQPIPPSDNSPPSNAGVTINNGASGTNSRSVTLTLSAKDDTGVFGYYASELSTTPLATLSSWMPIASTANYSGSVPFTLSPGNGTKTVYVWFKDVAGNVSAAASASITLE